MVFVRNFVKSDDRFSLRSLDHHVLGRLLLSMIMALSTSMVMALRTREAMV